MPNRDHQNLEYALENWLRMNWAKPRGNKVYHQINLAAPGGWPNRNFRVPDLVLLTPPRFGIDHNEYFEGAPDVIIEIHSPEDESYDKLPFYADLRVPEVWIVHRDTREPQVHVLGREGYRQQPAENRGWIVSPVTSV